MFCFYLYVQLKTVDANEDKELQNNSKFECFENKHSNTYVCILILLW